MATGVEESPDVEVKFSFGWGAYLYPTLVRVQLSHITGPSPYSLLHKHDTKDSQHAEPGKYTSGVGGWPRHIRE